MMKRAEHSSAPFYSIVRTRGRGIRIRILPTGQVQALAGPRVCVKDINAVVQANSDWIQAHRCPRRPAADLKPGGYMLLFGREYPVKFVQNPSVFFDGTQVFLSSDMTEKELVAELKRLLYPCVVKYVQDICKDIKTELKNISVNSARTRWGSCNQRARRINFSYRLVFAEQELIFSVAAHECAHLLCADHSRRFYDALTRIDPEWRLHRTMLRNFEKNYNILIID